MRSVSECALLSENISMKNIYKEARMEMRFSLTFVHRSYASLRSCIYNYVNNNLSRF